jgi:hypothetical protein
MSDFRALPFEDNFGEAKLVGEEPGARPRLQEIPGARPHHGRPILLHSAQESPPESRGRPFLFCQGPNTRDFGQSQSHL